MPTYEYQCPNGHQFELFQKMSDEPRASCPECGEAAERLLSGGAGFIFKGEGFYITDYRGDDYKRKAASEGSPSGDAKTKGGAKSADAEGGTGAGDTEPSSSSSSADKD